MSTLPGAAGTDFSGGMIRRWLDPDRQNAPLTIRARSILIGHSPP
ncbi:MAG TPA: hypothetical protein VGD78_15380 [Chthoniobacterales bacterium]